MVRIGREEERVKSKKVGKKRAREGIKQRRGGNAGRRKGIRNVE